MTSCTVNAQDSRSAALVERRLNVDPNHVVRTQLSSLDCQEAWRISRATVCRESHRGSMTVGVDGITLRDILLAM
jgi:hypothetical protein